MWRAGVAPVEWKDACMHAVYKRRGSRTSMDAYRGITDLSIDVNVYMMLLLCHLRLDTEEWMHDAQHGSEAAEAQQTASSTSAR